MLKLEKAPTQDFGPGWDSMGSYLGTFDSFDEAKQAGCRFWETRSEVGILDLAAPVKQFAGNAVLNDDICYVDDGSHLSQHPAPRHIQVTSVKDDDTQTQTAGPEAPPPLHLHRLPPQAQRVGRPPTQARVPQAILGLLFLERR
jgi:hypothetical protein